MENAGRTRGQSESRGYKSKFSFQHFARRSDHVHQCAPIPGTGSEEPCRCQRGSIEAGHAAARPWRFTNPIRDGERTGTEKPFPRGAASRFPEDKKRFTKGDWEPHPFCRLLAFKECATSSEGWFDPNSSPERRHPQRSRFV